MKDSFIFYRSFKESLEDLEDSDKLIMYEAISDYALDRIEPKLTGFPSALFKLIQPQLDANWRRYENGKKGGIHGAKGGAPQGNKNAANPKTTPKQPLNNPKTTPNDNDNGNVNVNVEKTNKKEIAFKNSIQPFVEKYGKDICNNFYLYWSEPNKSKTKLRFELEKTWDVGRRLANWASRDKDFKNNGKTEITPRYAKLD